MDLTSLEIHRYSNDHRSVSLVWHRNSLREWFFSRRVKFDSRFDVMAVYEVSWHGPIIISSLPWHPEMSREVVDETFWFFTQSTCLLPWIGRCSLKADVLRSWSPRVLIRPSAAGIFSISSRDISLLCIEYFRVVFWCVHRLQLLNVCNQHVTATNSPAYKAYLRNNPGKTFFPNWWIIDWSFAVIQWCSTNEPNGITSLVNGSPKRLSNGVFFPQTRDLELFAHSYSTPWNLFTNCRLDLIATILQRRLLSLYIQLFQHSFVFPICVVSTCDDSRKDLHRLCQIPRNCQCTWL